MSNGKFDMKEIHFDSGSLTVYDDGSVYISTKFSNLGFGAVPPSSARQLLEALAQAHGKDLVDRAEREAAAVYWVDDLPVGTIIRHKADKSLYQKRFDGAWRGVTSGWRFQPREFGLRENRALYDVVYMGSADL